MTLSKIHVGNIFVKIMHYKFIEAEESDRPEPEEVYMRPVHENLAATKFYGLPLTRSPETDKKDAKNNVITFPKAERHDCDNALRPIDKNFHIARQ